MTAAPLLVPRVDEALRESDERFRLLVDGVTDHAIYMLDREGNVVSWNQGAERLKGYTAAEVIGRNYSIFFLPEDVASGEPGAELARAATEGRFEREAWRVRKDGSRFWASVVLSALRDSDGELRGFAKVTRDISARWSGEQDALRAHAAKLAESERRYRDIVNALPQLAWTCSLDGECDFLNQRWVEYTGIPERPQLGYGWLERLHPEDRDGTMAAWNAAVAAATPFEVEFRIQGADGTYRWFKTLARQFRDTNGEVRWFGSNTDVDRQKRSEEVLRKTLDALARSNKELEQFAAVASHDLQEPLRKIRAFGARLAAREGHELGPEGRDDLGRMTGAAARMQDLIENLLTFSRVTTKAQPFARVELGEVVREVLSDLESRLEQTKGRVELDELPALDADATQMRQLFQNLVGNALKFHRPDVPPVVKITSRTLPGSEGVARCEIRVDDNGLGFEPQYAERIFGLFQRLHGRSEFEGTGIGLAICRKIVERHCGSIVATGTPGEGATFSITLPRAQREEVTVP